MANSVLPQMLCPKFKICETKIFFLSSGLASFCRRHFTFPVTQAHALSPALVLLILLTEFNGLFPKGLFTLPFWSSCLWAAAHPLCFDCPSSLPLVSYLFKVSYLFVRPTCLKITAFHPLLLRHYKEKTDLCWGHKPFTLWSWLASLVLTCTISLGQINCLFESLCGHPLLYLWPRDPLSFSPHTNLTTFGC